MAFDKAAFRQLVKDNYALAANPAFTPVPDAAIADDDARDRAHEAAMQRWALSREAAIADVAAHAAAHLVAARVIELWPAEGAKVDALVNSAQALITEGTGESLGDAAALLLIVGFAKLTNIVKE